MKMLTKRSKKYFLVYLYLPVLWRIFTPFINLEFFDLVPLGSRSSDRLAEQDGNPRAN
jgi:hypothetical protein